jgi:hypothetical protein
VLKINLAVYFLTFSILKDKIKKEKIKTIKGSKTKKKSIRPVDELVKLMNRVTWISTPNL